MPATSPPVKQASQYRCFLLRLLQYYCIRSAIPWTRPTSSRWSISARTRCAV